MTHVSANLSALDVPRASIGATIDQTSPRSKLQAAGRALESVAAQFISRLNLLERLGPLRDLNREMRQQQPDLESFFGVVDDQPEIRKTFLKLANSSWFNSRVEVDSPYMAFTRFGIQGFYRLVTAAFLTHAVGEFSTKPRLWPHLNSTGRAAEALSQKLAPNLADEAFITGLLHDVMLAPMQREIQDYSYFLEAALSADPAVTGLEASCNEFHHAQAAAELAHGLEFDEHIIEAVAGHHNETLASISPGNSRVLLGLLTTSKRALAMARGQKCELFESTTEKALLREIAATLGVTTGQVLSAASEANQ